MGAIYHQCITKFKKKIDNIISKIAKKLGITNGTIKGDLIVRKNKIMC